MKLGKNDPCHCGSGNKYKKCCLAKDDAARIAELNATAAAAKASQASQVEEVPEGEAGTKRAAADRARDAAPVARPKPTGKIQSPPVRRRAV